MITLQSVPEHRSHHFVNRCHPFEFLWWGTAMLPLLALSFYSGSKWCTHVSSILGHNSNKKIGWIRLKKIQKCTWNFKPVQLLVWCQHLGYLSGRQFAHSQHFCQSSMNRPDTYAQSFCNVYDSHTPIIYHHKMYPFHLSIGVSLIFGAMSVCHHQYFHCLTSSR